ncbi:hypothetical protein HDE78_000311 [Rhodanobacter sp. K2T2]|nr:hypothetical protein [Rhodanobacter sp. K2T2]
MIAALACLVLRYSFVNRTECRFMSFPLGDCSHSTPDAVSVITGQRKVAPWPVNAVSVLPAAINVCPERISILPFLC